MLTLNVLPAGGLSPVSTESLVLPSQSSSNKILSLNVLSNVEQKRLLPKKGRSIPLSNCNCKDAGLGRKIGNGYLCSHHNLRAKYPEIAADWDYTRNHEQPENILPVSNKKVYWICPKNPCGCHIYQATVYNRTLDCGGCPYCANQKVCPHNNLQVLFPNIANEWSELNEKSPDQYFPGSGAKVWWKCPNNTNCNCHIYLTSLFHRTSHGTSCPYCANQKVCPHNNLLTTYPNLIKEWSFNLNEKLPEAYTSGSKQKVWWICSSNNSHQYEASISHRTRTNPTGCPFCTKSKGEIIVASILKSRGIQFESQYILKYLPSKRYDFHFILGDDHYLIEYDGEFHFKEIPLYHREGKKSFNYRREIDKIKTFIACNTGFKLIRIDYTNLNNGTIEEQIDHALLLKFPIYYSDGDMYKWLSDEQIDMTIMMEEAPEFLRDFYPIIQK